LKSVKTLSNFLLLSKIWIAVDSEVVVALPEDSGAALLALVGLKEAVVAAGSGHGLTVPHKGEARVWWWEVALEGRPGLVDPPVAIEVVMDSTAGHLVIMTLMMRGVKSREDTWCSKDFGEALGVVVVDLPPSWEVEASRVDHPVVGEWDPQEGWWVDLECEEDLWWEDVGDSKGGPRWGALIRGKVMMRRVMKRGKETTTRDPRRVWWGARHNRWEDHQDLVGPLKVSLEVREWEGHNRVVNLAALVWVANLKVVSLVDRAALDLSLVVLVAPGRRWACGVEVVWAECPGLCKVLLVLVALLQEWSVFHR
jgi:hypothetical protein